MTDDNQFQRVQWDGDQPHLSDERGASLIGWGGNPGLSDVDLELLTLAARALGAVRVEPIEGENWVNLHFADGSTVYNWNPLQHNDDTFSLLVKLGLKIDANFKLSPEDSSGIGVWTPDDPTGTPLFWVVNTDEPEEFSRRLVTRAAAEIEKAKP